jgi:hypothetical protein
MGEPTAKPLREAGIEPTFIAQCSAVEDLFNAYSAKFIYG